MESVTQPSTSFLVVDDTTRAHHAPTDVGEFDGALHHAAGGVTVVGQDACRERPVVGTDAHSPAQLLALEH